jgi:hypothetical protein
MVCIGAKAEIDLYFIFTIYSDFGWSSRVLFVNAIAYSRLL